MSTDALLADGDDDDARSKEFSVNTVCFRRAWRVLRLGLGRPAEEPRLWALMAFNVIVQVLAGWDAQSHFYYTGTGTGPQDPVRRISQSTSWHTVYHGIH